MSDQAQIGAALSGVTQAIAITAPQLVAASPKVAAVVAVAELAPIALNFLNSAATMHSIGGLTADQLAALFVSVGQGIQASHDKWAAMNEPKNSLSAHEGFENLSKYQSGSVQQQGVQLQQQPMQFGLQNQAEQGVAS